MPVNRQAIRDAKLLRVVEDIGEFSLEINIQGKTKNVNHREHRDYTEELHRGSCRRIGLCVFLGETQCPPWLMFLSISYCSCFLGEKLQRKSNYDH